MSVRAEMAQASGAARDAAATMRQRLGALPQVIAISFGSLTLR